MGLGSGELTLTLTCSKLAGRAESSASSAEVCPPAAAQCAAVCPLASPRTVLNHVELRVSGEAPG